MGQKKKNHFSRSSVVLKEDRRIELPKMSIARSCWSRNIRLWALYSPSYEMGKALEQDNIVIRL